MGWRLLSDRYQEGNAMRLTRAFIWPVAVLLAACNLQAATPTVPASDTPPPATEALTPTSPPLQPTLLPTPGQFLPGQPEQPIQPLPPPPLPVTVNAPGGSLNVQPTLDPAVADDRYEVELGAGDTRAIVYEVTLTRGGLALQIQGADGVVWRKVLNASESSREQFTVQQGGVYELLVFRQNFDGNYAFRWE